MHPERRANAPVHPAFGKGSHTAEPTAAVVVPPPQFERRSQVRGFRETEPIINGGPEHGRKKSCMTALRPCVERTAVFRYPRLTQPDVADGSRGSNASPSQKSQVVGRLQPHARDVVGKGAFTAAQTGGIATQRIAVPGIGSVQREARALGNGIAREDPEMSGRAFGVGVYAPEGSIRMRIAAISPDAPV